MQKNEVIELTIESLSNDGNGVGHCSGMAVFVAFTVPGDRIRARIAKVSRTFAFGILLELLSPGPCRIEPDCPVFGRCGGCALRQISYTGELEAKTKFVQDAFDRIGGFHLKAEACIPSPKTDGYRSKVQLPLEANENGKIVCGFFAARSHRIVPNQSCLLQPQILNEIAVFLCSRFEAYRLSVYDERSGKGLLRHLVLRTAQSGDIQVCIVAAAPRIPHETELAKELTGKFPRVVSVVINENAGATNVILGRRNRAVFGGLVLRDTLCGIPMRLVPSAFCQVNPAGAEKLYETARQLASPAGNDLILDLYCGTGTIGLSMLSEKQRLIGVEIEPDAVESARCAAAETGHPDAEFFCEDAGAAAKRLAEQNIRPDIVVTDPPRKGCDRSALDAILTMAPSRIVMISCYAPTAARDVRILADGGYELKALQPVDMFPRTKHVETVVLMSRVKE